MVHATELRSRHLVASKMDDGLIVELESAVSDRLADIEFQGATALTRASICGSKKR